MGRHNDGLNELDRASGRFQRFLHDPENPHSIGHNYVTSVLEDRSPASVGGFAFGSGLSALDPKTGDFTRYSFHPEEPSSQGVTGVQGIVEDRDGNLWLCSVDRGLLKFDRERKTFTRYSNEPGDPNSLAKRFRLRLFEDAEGEMWVGTQDGLSHFRHGPAAFLSYKHQPGNPIVFMRR